MYDWPEVREATDALWRGIAEELERWDISAPADLDRDGRAPEQWLSPGLVLSQTCGLPFVDSLRGRVRLVGVPVYAAEGHVDHNYHSAILVRTDDPAQRLADLCRRRVAVNAQCSHSGWIALRAAAAAAIDAGEAAVPFFHDGVLTGSHRGSMGAVAAGDADYCAVDSVCLALARRRVPDLVERLRPVERTPSAPGLPLITSVHRGDAEIATIRASLRAVLSRPDLHSAREVLMLEDIVSIEDASYDRIVQLKHRGAGAGPDPRFHC